MMVTRVFEAEEPPTPSPGGQGPCSPYLSKKARLIALRILSAALISAFFIVFLSEDPADARRKKRRPVEPPLRILSITLSPETYVSGNGSLDFAIEVALPLGIDDSTLLEVSSLITSPSKRYLRFLASRKPIQEFLGAQLSDDSSSTNQESGEGPAEKPGEHTPNRVLVTLSWDGTDQNNQRVTSGPFDYLIRAKLLAVMDRGPRTTMVSWKKKGKLRVEEPDVQPSEDPDIESEPERESAP